MSTFKEFWIPPWLTRLRSQRQSQRAVTGPIANEDTLKEIDRRIVTLMEVAEVVPNNDQRSQVP